MNMIKIKRITVIILCIISVILLSLFFRFPAYCVEVPTGSMLPNIQLDEKLLILQNKCVLQYKRGDIVVFHRENNDTPLVKRLIGMPNETVDIRNGSVYIDGEPLIEDYLGSNDEFTGTFYVPEDSYLFLGDNRSDSLDARYWDNPYVHKDYLEGKVIAHLYPKFKIGG